MKKRLQLRMTRQRRVILEELEKSTAHPTAGELFDIVRRRLPKISLGTVYRTLEILAASGQARKLELAGDPARFDGRVDGHYHIRCVSCGRVDDVDSAPLPDLEGALQEQSDYRITGFRLECSGICPECGGNRDTPPGR